MDTQDLGATGSPEVPDGGHVEDLKVRKTRERELERKRARGG